MDFKPAVSKNILLIIAGLMYSAVGVMLWRMAIEWLTQIEPGLAMTLGVSGGALAIGAYIFGFSKLAQKNIERLCLLSDKGCVFAFQAWKTYILIAFMITLGAVLRRSSIPKHYLAFVYEIIGGALFLASIQYYVRVWHRVSNKKIC